MTRQPDPQHPLIRPSSSAQRERERQFALSIVHQLFPDISELDTARFREVDNGFGLRVRASAGYRLSLLRRKGARKQTTADERLYVIEIIVMEYDPHNQPSQPTVLYERVQGKDALGELTDEMQRRVVELIDDCTEAQTQLRAASPVAPPSPDPLLAQIRASLQQQIEQWEAERQKQIHLLVADYQSACSPLERIQAIHLTAQQVEVRVLKWAEQGCPGWTEAIRRGGHADDPYSTIPRNIGALSIEEIAALDDLPRQAYHTYQQASIRLEMVQEIMHQLSPVADAHEGWLQ